MSHTPKLDEYRVVIETASEGPQFVAVSELNREAQEAVMRLVAGHQPVSLTGSVRSQVLSALGVTPQHDGGWEMRVEPSGREVQNVPVSARVRLRTGQRPGGGDLIEEITVTVPPAIALRPGMTMADSDPAVYQFLTHLASVMSRNRITGDLVGFTVESAPAARPSAQRPESAEAQPAGRTAIVYIRKSQHLTESVRIDVPGNISVPDGARMTDGHPGVEEFRAYAEQVIRRWGLRGQISGFTIGKPARAPARRAAAPAPAPARADSQRDVERLFTPEPVVLTGSGPGRPSEDGAMHEVQQRDTPFGQIALTTGAGIPKGDENDATAFNRDAAGYYVGRQDTVAGYMWDTDEPGAIVMGAGASDGVGRHSHAHAAAAMTLKHLLPGGDLETRRAELDGDLGTLPLEGGEKAASCDSLTWFRLRRDGKIDATFAQSGDTTDAIIYPNTGREPDFMYEHNVATMIKKLIRAAQERELTEEEEDDLDSAIFQIVISGRDTATRRKASRVTGNAGDTQALLAFIDDLEKRNGQPGFGTIDSIYLAKARALLIQYGYRKAHHLVWNNIQHQGGSLHVRRLTDVPKGAVAINGSDGVFDNMPLKEVQWVIEQVMDRCAKAGIEVSAKTLCSLIVRMAVRLAKNDDKKQDNIALVIQILGRQPQERPQHASALARICDEVEREWFAGETERDRRFEEEEQETRELIGLLVNDGDSWQRHNDEARQIEARMAGGS